MVQPHLHPLVKTQMTFGTVEAVHMKLTTTKVPDGIIHGEHNVTSSTSGSKHSVEVFFAVKLTKFCEAGSIKFNFAHLTFETIFMKGAISYPEHDLVVYRGPTLGTLRHPVAVRPYSGPCLTILSCVSPRLVRARAVTAATHTQDGPITGLRHPLAAHHWSLVPVPDLGSILDY